MYCQLQWILSFRHFFPLLTKRIIYIRKNRNTNLSHFFAERDIETDGNVIRVNNAGQKHT